MKLTKDYVRKTIEEVAPIVEELSELKCNVIKSKIEIVDYMFFPQFRKYYADTAAYHQDNVFIFNNCLNGNSDFFEGIIAHEIMHNAQHYNFPERFNLIIDDLIEGDATLIQKAFSKKHLKKPRMNFFKFPIIPLNWIIDTKYKASAKILQKKFNGNRKDINELYTAPLEELAKIFK